NHVVAYLKQHVPSQDSLLIFPDSGIIWGMTGHVAPIGTPFCFSPPAPGYPTIASGKVLEHYQKELTQHPPRWLVLHSSPRALFNADLLKRFGLEEWARKNYHPEWSDGEFAVLKFVSPPTREVAHQ